MKKLKLIILIASATIIQSCDPCLNTFCQNGGVCANGVCKCPSGFEGTNCEINSRDKFIGNWNLVTTTFDVNTGQAIEENSLVTITAGNQTDEILISTLKDFEVFNIDNVLFKINGNKILKGGDPRFLADEINNIPTYWQDFNASSNPKFAISQTRFGIGQIPTQTIQYRFN